jgi:hypothetical protein
LPSTRNSSERLSLTSSRNGVRVNPQKNARVTGVLFLITFITSIPALILYGPVLNNPNYIVGAGADTRIYWGAFLEVILAIAGIGTAVALFPILKWQYEGFALGYVATRVVESTIIVVGIISVLSVVTLRQDLAGAPGANAASLETVGTSLVAVKDWTFLFGPGFCAGIGNGILLGYMMYSSRLLPRYLAVVGLVGGPLAVASATAMLFGLYEQVSVWASIAIIPEFLWELSFGIWLTVRGFNPSAVARLQQGSP